MKKVAGIILAAGKSSRMGGKIKQLLDLGGKPMLQHVVDHARGASFLHEIIVVAGNGSERLSEQLDFKGVRVVFNPDFDKGGQSSSLKAGVSAVDPACEASIFLLGDMPTVDSATIDAIAGRFAETGAPIVVPVLCGKPGNPVLFARSFFPDILRLEGDIGARPLLLRYSRSIATLEVGHAGIHRDIDTLADYFALRG